MRGVDSTAYLVCKPEFVPVGYNVSTCCYDGIWRPELGSCKLKEEYKKPYCKPYTSIKIPELEYNPPIHAIALNSTVTLKCAIGQRLQGNGKSKCVDGLWTPTLGTCVDEDKIDND
ncbi:hypothetical protein LOAG_15733 [Loa loa]|nr:hypothetical protein LOAG_15733 [Loa loa]EFO12800.2 hypothetical protein LOAG_15733 [Loa loa]